MEVLSTERRYLSEQFPNYSQPKEVGIFSLTSKGFFSDGRNLKYYREPKNMQNVHLDLNQGFPEKFVDWKGEGGDLDHILKWITEAKRKNPSRGWKLAVTKFNGTWYISHVPEQWNDDPRTNCWGHKFEQYMTADTAEGEPNIEGKVDLNETFYTVVTSKLNSHSLLFSAEVDGRVPDDKVSPPTRYVEMKTNKVLRNQNDKRNFDR
uniref:Decapping nuclease n=1 Tax=Branchiostoma floridae TaxID=7739 RepID=C3XUU8_BRAFL|eukprot:XP_002612164.1 hypothetical protein BRAFLDRAFT_88903 [Branchiostoma floridae]